VKESIDLYAVEAELRKSRVHWGDDDIVNIRKIKRVSQLQYVSLPSPENKRLYTMIFGRF
jgi:hypothetical protein